MPGDKRSGQGYLRRNKLRKKIRESDEKTELLKKNIKAKKESQDTRQKLIDNLEDQKQLDEFKRKGIRTILS